MQFYNITPRAKKPCDRARKGRIFPFLSVFCRIFKKQNQPFLPTIFAIIYMYFIPLFATFCLLFKKIFLFGNPFFHIVSHVPPSRLLAKPKQKGAKPDIFFLPLRWKFRQVRPCPHAGGSSLNIIIFFLFF